MPWLVLVLLLLLVPVASSAQETDLALPSVREFDADSLSGFAGRSVRAIDWSGQKVTRDYVIRREIRTPVDRPLDVQLAHEDVRRLENLSIFAEVRLVATAEGDSGVRLAFVLREMPPVIPLLAISYTEENGFSAGPGISSNNLRGRAVSLSGRAYFGSATQYWVRATWPWITGNHVMFDAYAARLIRPDKRNDFNEDSDEITLRFGKHLGDKGRLVGTMSYLGMTSDVPSVTLSPDGHDDLYSIAVTAGLDTRDSYRMPRRGWFNEIELGKTGGALGGDGDFRTLILDVRRWMPVGPKQRTMLSGLFTYQDGTIDVDYPEYLRYHIGGANSVRGYPVQGPDETLAGRNQLLATVEHSYSLIPVRRFDFFKWSIGLGLDATAFGDAGWAWNEPEEFAFDKARTGYGIGFRLLVPGGEMVRFDFGWNGKDAIQFHLASGSKPASQRKRIR